LKLRVREIGGKEEIKRKRIFPPGISKILDIN
jgi:hypothetical protein